VFRVDAVGFCGLVEVFGGAETVVDDDGFVEFFLGDAVDRISAGFVFEHCSTGNEPLAFRGVVLAFAKEDPAVVFDHEVDGDERDVRDDRAPLVVGDRFVGVGHQSRW
jgi:hypothetical protein